MLRLSKHVINAMGFEERNDKDVLNANFGVLNVYTIQGIHLDEEDNNIIKKPFPFGENCTVAIAQSVNEASQLLIGDNYTDDETGWLTEKKATAPFILIYFKEKIERELEGGYLQEDNDHIQIYDAICRDKQELEEWEKQELPSIITSFAVHFSSLKNQVKLIPVDRSVFGKTKQGKTVFSIKFTMTGELIFPVRNNLNDITLNLEKSYELYSKLNEKSSRHIYNALIEPDRLKQFLNYFLFIERFTHSQYKVIKAKYEIDSLFSIPNRLNELGLDFFKSYQDNAKNLSQRFHWCALVIWENLDNQDIKTFKEVKSIRDKISHGEDISDSSLPLEQIKLLALKLLGTK